MRHTYFLCRECLVQTWIQHLASTQRSPAAHLKLKVPVSVSFMFSTKGAHRVGKQHKVDRRYGNNKMTLVHTPPSIRPQEIVRSLLAPRRFK